MSIYLILRSPYEAGAIVIPILQMRKLRHREGDLFKAEKVEPYETASAQPFLTYKNGHLV